VLEDSEMRGNSCKKLKWKDYGEKEETTDFCPFLRPINNQSWN
jgi:hypothetical protein